MKCVRCGKPASAQWQICADKNIYRPVCQECDIAINKIVLSFMFPNRDIERIINGYRKSFDK